MNTFTEEKTTDFEVWVEFEDENLDDFRVQSGLTSDEAIAFRDKCRSEESSEKFKFHMVQCVTTRRVIH